MIVASFTVRKRTKANAEEQRQEAQPATTIDELLSVLGELTEVIAAQADQTADLESEVDQLRQQLVVVKSQEIVQDVLRDLGDRGYSAEPHEVTIRTEGVTSEEVHESRSSHSASSDRTDVQAKIDGLFRNLVSLGVKVARNKNSLDRSLKRAAKSRRERQKVELSWKIGGISAPSNPKDHAKAFKIRAGNR